MKNYNKLIKNINQLTDDEKINIKNNINVIKDLDYEEDNIKIHIESDIELYTRTISCKKEPEIVDWINSNFKSLNNPVFYDIGANIGAYSLVASMFVKKQIKVYAFEPSFINYFQLNKNIILNNCQNCIVPLNIALSDLSELGNFNYSSLDTGSAAHAFGEAIGETGEQFQPSLTSLMHSYRLDDLINTFNFEIPNFIKIDVDGIEMKILEGAKDTLNNDTLKSLVVEIVYEKDADEFIKFLKEFKFEFFSRHEYSGVSPGYNYIFNKK